MTNKSGEKKNSGRPSLKPEDKASEQVYINLTSDEKTALKSYAKKIKLSVSSLLRTILAEKNII
ncbi:MAG: hypothetical protein AB7D34_02240 [Sulfurimonas sp.]